MTSPAKCNSWIRWLLNAPAPSIKNKHKHEDYKPKNQICYRTIKKKKKGKIIFLHIAEERFLPTETRAEWQEVVRCWESLRSPPNQRGETSLSTLVIQLRPQKGHSLPHLFVWNYFLKVYSEHFKDWFRLLLYQLDYDCFTFHSVK